MTETRGRDLVAAVSEATRKRLDDLKTGLQSAVGDDLSALIVYGSAVLGGFREGSSDIDVIVVLRDASRARLEAIANVLQVARYAARIEAMILLESEIPRAADVYPLLYDDIRQCHALLAGTDPFSNLEIPDHHRRLRIEQELREAQIRLRRLVVDGMGSKDALAGAVTRKVKQLRSPLHALMQLRGTPCEPALEAVVAAAGKAYDVDVMPITRARETPHEAHDAVTRLLSAAILDVDSRDVAGTAVGKGA